MNDVGLGNRCIYRPRVPYGRQSELFCFITRIVNEAEGIVDLIAFPANSEVMHVNNVARRSDAISIHCWEPAGESAAGFDEAAAKAIADAARAPLAAEIQKLLAERGVMQSNWAETLAKLETRIAALEKRQPRQSQLQPTVGAAG